MARIRGTFLRSRLFTLVGLIVSIVTIAGVAYAAPVTIKTVAGNGVGGYNGDHKKATRASLNFPIDVAPFGKGSFYIADEVNERIRLVNAKHVITTVAGNGVVCAGHIPNSLTDPCGDLRKAKHAELSQPTGVTALRGGGFLIADRADNVIRKVNRRGIISTVAGTGDQCAPLVAGSCGDGGPATLAKLDYPDRAAPTSDGGFLITEDGGNRVRKVDAAGNISTVAGHADGTQCFVSTTACGDGLQATSAYLNGPDGVSVFADGSFVIADFGDNKIRLVGTDGVMTTLAGDGNPGSFGDGISATSANLNSPGDVAVAPDQSVIVADTYSHLVRRVVSSDTGPIISTIAGVADTAGTCVNGTAATSCELNTPFGVGIDRKGRVFIADHLNHFVRRLSTHFK